MRTRISLGLVLVLPLCWAAAVAAQTPPEIALDATGATISGLPAKGNVAWLMVARQVEDMGLRLVRMGDMVADEGGDGIVAVELDRPLPEQSVWVAADVKEGGYAIAAPEGFPLQVTELSASAISHEGDAVELPSHQLELLIVRPGVGAWGGTFGDGGPEDLSGDGLLKVNFDSLAPLGGTEPATAGVLESADLLVAVDSTSLDLYIRVGGA
ncbi:MAG TPA: hypothetical protein VN811_16110 [Thermoanaerobaculia bacterium]|nr:hypothetical protein [Thermoanaerobaculia bacterium]